MAPRAVHFIRHAQGYHNVHNDQTIPDPDLTPKGRKQCKHLSTVLPYFDSIDLHGALLAFYEEHDSSSATCPGTPAEPENTPSGIKRLQDEYGSIVNFERCYELSDYDSKTATFAPDGRHLEERATTLHKFLRDRKEEEIVVVSLGQFLHYVSRDVDDDGKQIHGDWENTEYRSYIFWPVGHEDALLKEMLC